MLDQHARITETSTSAFYAVIDGTICTPADNVLSSTTRLLVEEAARACEIPFLATDLTLNDLPSFDSAFVSSTASGLLPVASINGVAISCGDVLPKLLDWWQATTGINPLQQILGQ